jgi:hypothetical protein
MSTLAALCLTVERVVMGFDTMRKLRLEVGTRSGPDPVLSWGNTTLFGAKVVTKKLDDVPPDYLELREEEMYL